MPTIKQAAKEFLSHKCISVIGVFAVNPNATTVEGDICYPNLTSIPEEQDGVVIVTKPGVISQILKECSELGIKNVWMHKGIDSKTASVSDEAVKFCHENNINVIPGGCPMMYINNADIGHRFMRRVQNLTGSLSKQV